MKDKNQDFLFMLMPDLKPMKLLKGDILYQERDHAEELYFIKQGKIKLHIDINYFDAGEEDEDFEELENSDAELDKQNIPFIAYVEGSHFGDVDIFCKEGSLIRDSTAITTNESHFFVLSRESIIQLRRMFKTEIQEMEDLAKKR